MKEKILIVEDDAIIAYSLLTLLKMYNFQVLGPVDSVKEAYNICVKKHPHIILLDINLNGDEKGTTLVNKIRSASINSSIIYLTALNDQDTIEEIKKTEPILYLNKPIINDVLIANIELILKKLKADDTMVRIKNGQKNLIVNLDKIKYLQSDRNYVNIILVSGIIHIVRNKLDTIEDSLAFNSNHFTRINQSLLVNDKYITSFDKNSIQIDKHTFNISKKYLEIFRLKFTP